MSCLWQRKIENAAEKDGSKNSLNIFFLTLHSLIFQKKRKEPTCLFSPIIFIRGYDISEFLTLTTVTNKNLIQRGN
jgi:hypothetical protein